MITPACRSPTNSICRRRAPTIRPAGASPKDIVFQTKPQITLAQIRPALLAGRAERRVADAGYGIDTGFRDGVTWIALCRRHPVFEVQIINLDLEDSH